MSTTRQGGVHTRSSRYPFVIVHSVVANKFQKKEKKFKHSQRTSLKHSHKKLLHERKKETRLTWEQTAASVPPPHTGAHPPCTACTRCRPAGNRTSSVEPRPKSSTIGESKCPGPGTQSPDTEHRSSEAESSIHIQSSAIMIITGRRR